MVQHVTSFNKRKGNASGVFFEGVYAGLRLPASGAQIVLLAADITDLRTAWDHMETGLELDESAVCPVAIFRQSDVKGK